MIPRHTLVVLIAWLMASGAVWAQDGIPLAGRVVNENGEPLEGARIILRPAGNPEAEIQAYTNPAGEYRTTVPEPGEYRADVECKGYFALHDAPVTLAAEPSQTDFTLNRIREVFESVDVSATPPPINMETTQTQETVTGREINNIPYSTSNDLRTALRTAPGVLPDNRGRLHINGGKEEQAFYTLNGFNITDPLSGRFETRLSVESVQTVDVVSGLVSAEYGKGSAGVLAINTKTGDDKFRATATNFVPGLETQGGFHIGNWTPRVNFSGPIKRGRAWFSNTLDTVYTNTIIKELPKGDNNSSSWLVSNHLTTQVNLTPANILHAGFLTNFRLAPRYGLGVLDPRETTVDERGRQWFFHAKDQIYLPRQILLEVGYAANRTFAREIPQGQDLYHITPDGRTGNYFVDATREASRDQVLGNVFLPTFNLLGEHRVKVGVDLDRLSYWQDAHRTGIVNYGADFIRSRTTVFKGSGLAQLVNYESGVYLQDSWKPRPRLLFEVGVRGDWDQILHYWNASPRLGVAWQPPGLSRTKISGGYGIIYDATNLRVFTRPMDQYSLTTYFGDNGQPIRGPALTVFTILNPHPARPRYHNWTVSVEQEFAHGVHGRVEYLRKRGYLGFTYLNNLADTLIPQAWPGGNQATEFDALYELTNDRRDKYDHVRLTVHQTIKRQYEWMFSYTLSRAYSNAVVDANIDDPLLVYDNTGPMPWDTPHRLMSWGYFPTPWKNWSVAYLSEWHSGFPFSIVDENSRVIGGVNTRRYPDYFSLNLHVERRFEFKSQLWALRAGCNNVTNRLNPTVVNSNTASQNFMQFYGGADRSFNFRIRWLGKVAQ